MTSLSLEQELKPRIVFNTTMTFSSAENVERVERLREAMYQDTFNIRRFEGCPTAICFFSSFKCFDIKPFAEFLIEMGDMVGKQGWTYISLWYVDNEGKKCGDQMLLVDFDRGWWKLHELFEGKISD